jgi:hypothetical protein
LGFLVLLVFTAVVGAGAGPATPSYHAIDRVMLQIEQEWKGLSPEQNPHGESWLGYFQGLRQELKEYTAAKDADARVASLNKLYAKAQALDSTRWPAAVKLRNELRHWLRPRIALSWAEYRLIEALPSDQAELKEKWIAFLDKSLRPAVRDVESAGTVAAQLSALSKLHDSSDALGRSIATRDWSKSRALQQAIEELYSAPNVEVSIDANGVSSFIMPQGIVEPGPVYFREQWSYVTAGPVLGIGFIPTSDGIQVSVRQALTSVTPVRGFQEQIAADSQGQRAAKMYQFSATTRNDAVLTMVALFRVASGLYLGPNYEHGVSATINSTPQPGGGLPRLLASLMGQNQKRITDKVYEGAIGPMRENVVDGSRELSGIRTSESAAQLNAQIRPYVLDHQTMGTDKWKLTHLSLETFSTHAVARGTLGAGSITPRGASTGQPSTLGSPAAGVTADVHLPSALSSLLAGYYEEDSVRGVENILLEPAGVGEEGPKVSSNVDFATYLKALQDARAAGKPGRVVRIAKPAKAPQFSADANGNLVVLVKDLKLDVPAPEQAARGGLTGPPARVYRVQSPQAEVSLAIVREPVAPGDPERFVAQIVGIDAGPGLQVLAINEDEAQAVPLNMIQARVVLAAMSGSASGQKIPLPLNSLPLSNFVINSVSKLDPTGWIRVVLVPTSTR